MSFIIIDVCLTDLPKSKITVGKNGKSYMKLKVAQKRAVDDYGNTHYVSVNKTKEETEKKVDTIYVGTGKEYVFQGDSKPQESKPVSSEHKSEKSALDPPDDLPF
jgi:hypothetical protein